jgi:hypothetical protein
LPHKADADLAARAFVTVWAATGLPSFLPSPWLLPTRPWSAR